MAALKRKNNHRRTKSDLTEDVERIKEALSLTSHDIKFKAGELLTDSLDDIKDRTSAVKNNLENYTADKPLKSLGIALAVGLAVGYLMRK